MRPLWCLILTCRCKEGCELQLRRQCSCGQTWRSMMSFLQRRCDRFTSLLSPRSARQKEQNSSSIIFSYSRAELTCDSRREWCAMREWKTGGVWVTAERVGRRRAVRKWGSGKMGRRFVEFVKSLSTTCMGNQNQQKNCRKDSIINTPFLCTRHNLITTWTLIDANLIVIFIVQRKTSPWYNIRMLSKKSEKIYYPHLIQSRKLPLDFFPKLRKDSARGHRSQPPLPPPLTRTPSLSAESALFTFRRSSSYNKLNVPGAEQGGVHVPRKLMAQLVRLPPLGHKKQKQNYLRLSFKKMEGGTFGNDRTSDSRKAPLRL